MTKFEDHFLENFANSKYIYIYIEMLKNILFETITIIKFNLS